MGSENKKGASKDEILKKLRRNARQTLVWIARHGRYLSFTNKIIKRNLHSLYSNLENESLFPNKLINLAERRGTDLREIY